MLKHDRIDISEDIDKTNLIKQMDQKNVTYVSIGILKMLVINMNHIFAMIFII